MDVFTGQERRRCWAHAQKLGLLPKVSFHGATVSEVARRHDITRQHISQWRQEIYRKCGVETTVTDVAVHVLSGARNGHSRAKIKPGDLTVEARMMAVTNWWRIARASNAVKRVLLGIPCEDYPVIGV